MKKITGIHIVDKVQLQKVVGHKVPDIDRLWNEIVTGRKTDQDIMNIITGNRG